MTHEQMLETMPTPLDLCVDCTYVNANGWDESVADDWLGFPPHWEWIAVSISPCGGDDYDDLYCEGHTVKPGQRCDGCDTTLGGYRFCHMAVAR